MALARDLLKIYGLVFGNLLIILSVQFIIVAFTFSEEESGLSQEQNIQILYPCIPVLLAGVILVAIILQRHTVPFYWVGSHQARHGGPPAIARRAAHGPYQQPHRPGPTQRPLPATPPLSPSESSPREPRPTAREGPGMDDRTGDRRPAVPYRDHEAPTAPLPPPPRERAAADDNPNYLRYSRGLHYAPRYHGPRYYQPAHRDQPANIGPSFHRYTTRPYPPRGVRPQGPLQQPRYQPSVAPYRRGTHIGLEIKEALHLPSFKYMFLAFMGSLVLGFCSLTLGGIWLVVFPLAFVIAFSFPPLMWIAYIYQRTQERLEPQRLVFITLSWGMISTIPSLVFNTLGAVLLDADLNKLFEEGGTIGFPELAAVAIVAPLVEEFFKPLGLLLIFRRLESSYTGVLYGVACGMGFALIENMLYELSFLFMPGADVTAVWTFNSFARGVGSTLLHAVGPAFVGFALASVHLRGLGSQWILGAYLLGVGMHAAWNASATLTLYLGDDELLGMLEIVFLVVLFLACLVILRALLSTSLAQQRRKIAVTGPLRPPSQPRPPPRFT